MNQNLNQNSDIKQKRAKALKIIKILENLTKDMQPPMVPLLIAKFGKDPFLILISCLLSLRSRDTVTLPICVNLFQIARTPSDFIEMPLIKLERLIKSVNYYKTKAKVIKSVSKDILERFKGKVPSNIDDLLSIKGVGRKTANLVLSEAFDVPTIFVDTHIHRISNELKIVQTNNPFETEIELKKIVPKKYWEKWCRLLVTWGQNQRSIEKIYQLIN